MTTKRSPGAPKKKEVKQLVSYKFSPGVIERLHKMIPEGKRGKFVETAIVAALDMLEGKQ